MNSPTAGSLDQPSESSPSSAPGAVAVTVAAGKGVAVVDTSDRSLWGSSEVGSLARASGSAVATAGSMMMSPKVRPALCLSLEVRRQLSAAGGSPVAEAAGGASDG